MYCHQVMLQHTYFCLPDVMQILLACLPCMECILYPSHVQSLPGVPIAPVMTTIVLGCHLILSYIFVYVGPLCIAA